MKRFLELVFAVVVMAMTFAASADLILVQVEKDYPGAFSKTVDGEEVWFITLDDATKYEVGYDSSWWYKPEKSNVTTTPANIKKPDGTSFGEIDITTEDTPETLETKIRNTLKQHSVEVAYSAAAVALAKAMWSELQAKVIREQIDTMAKSMQANLLNIDTSDFFTFTDDNNNNYKCLNDSGLVKASGTNSKVSQLKTLRDMLGTEAGKDITITKGQLIREGVGTLSGGGGGIPGTDGVSVTNMKFWVNGKQTNELALAGWWKNNYKSNKGPSPDFICDFTLDEMTKPVNEQNPNFKKHYILTREDSGKLHYMPMTNQLKVAVTPDNISIQTNGGVIALHSFTNGEHDAELTIGQILVADKDEEPVAYYCQTNAYVVVRTTESDGSNELWYLPVGDLSVNKPDGKSINRNTLGDPTNRLQIAGFDAATNTASKTQAGSAFSDKMFASSSEEGICVPVKNGDGIQWLVLGNYNITEELSGLEAKITATGQGAEQAIKRQFELANWSSITQGLAQTTSLAELITSESQATSNLYFLAKNVSSGTLEYIVLGNLQQGADEESVTLAPVRGQESAQNPSNVFQIVGFKDAAVGLVPMKVTVKGKDGKPDTFGIAWTNMAAATAGTDNISIENHMMSDQDTNGIHMVKGFVTQQPEADSLDTILGEDKDNKEGDDKIQVLARKMPKDATLDGSTNGFSIVYLDIKNGLMTTNWKNKVTGPDNYNGGKTYLNPSATNNQAVTGLAMNPDYLNDGHSISTNGQSLLQLVGFDTAPDNTYPLKRSGNWAWATPKRGDADYTATASGVAKRFSIETIDTETYTNMLQLSGFGTTLKNQMMYVDVDGSDREIKWTNTPAPDSDDSANVYGKSIEKHIDVDDNIAYWGLKGYMTATVNQVPYKQADGTLGWKLTGGADVDDTSITTNYNHGAVTANKASIYGFRTASAGDVPHKKADGSIEWKPVAGGDALVIEGTSGTTVTTATCTNKLSFVSASDSNVKFTVTDEGNGNVKVTVGVYWK